MTKWLESDDRPVKLRQIIVTREDLLHALRNVRIVKDGPLME